MQPLDWRYVHAFLAVSEAGSLTAAASRTGLSQPTLGRHINTLEAQLGAALFIRSAAGLRLTEAGESMLEAARDMAAAAHRFAAQASGHQAGVSGTVRITASQVVSHFLLPPIIADMRQREPEIEIELVPTDTAENLMFREADIAIRMFRPTQLDIITRSLGTLALALYATPAVLAQWGEPQSMEAWGTMPFVGFDRSEMILRYMRDGGARVDRHFFAVRCDDQAAYWHLVCAGCGAGAMQRVIGDAEPRVRRLRYQPNLPALPVWLAAYERVYQSPRVKRVWDMLVEELLPLMDTKPSAQP